jgi:plasmid stabilization system protein ParE
MHVIWSHPATADLLKIADYYDRIDPGLALDMVDRVVGGVTPLLDNPRIGPVLDEQPDVRKWNVPHTPFLLFYVVAGDRIEIRRVRHVRERWRA